jgi:hypothetical protein
MSCEELPRELVPAEQQLLESTAKQLPQHVRLKMVLDLVGSLLADAGHPVDGHHLAADDILVLAGVNRAPAYRRLLFSLNVLNSVAGEELRAEWARRQSHGPAHGAEGTIGRD